MIDENIPINKDNEPNVLETNAIVRILWNVLFACLYPFIITFSLIVSSVVFIISFIGNLIIRLFRK